MLLQELLVWLRGHLLARDRLLNDLTLPECVGVAHEDLCLGLPTNLVKLGRIVAADTGAGRAAEAIVGEALAVQLETAALPAVARLGGLSHENHLLVLLMDMQ